MLARVLRRGRRASRMRCSARRLLGKRVAAAMVVWRLGCAASRLPVIGILQARTLDWLRSEQVCGERGRRSFLVEGLLRGLLRALSCPDGSRVTSRKFRFSAPYNVFCGSSVFPLPTGHIADPPLPPPLAVSIRMASARCYIWPRLSLSAVRMTRPWRTTLLWIVG